MLSAEHLDSVSSELRQIQREMGSVSSLPVYSRQEELRLVIVGEFSTGKSSLVNAILGEAILPVRVTPATAVITELRYADQPVMHVRYLDGSAKQIPPTSDALQSLTADQPEVAKVELAEIGHPAVPKGLVIVDTPGTNDISKTRTEIVYRILPTADAVWMVMSARAPLKASEMHFLRDKVIGADLTRVRFIINQIDTLSEDEVAEAVGYVREGLTSAISDLAREYRALGSEMTAPALERMSGAVPVTAISATRALSGEEEHVNILNRLMHELESFAEELNEYRVSRLAAACERACRNIDMDIERMRKMSDSSQAEIVKSIKEQTSELDKAVLDVRNLSRSFRSTVNEAKGRSLARVSEAFAVVKREALTRPSQPMMASDLEAKLRRELEVIAEELMKEVSEASNGVVAESIELGQLSGINPSSLPTPSSNSPKGISGDIESYFARPSTYFIAMASALIFGPLGFVAVCAFPFIESLLSGNSTRADIEAALTREFARLENEACDILSQAVDYEIATTESILMNRIDVHQTTLLHLIDALETNADPSVLDDWYGRMTTSRSMLLGRDGQ